MEITFESIGPKHAAGGALEPSSDSPCLPIQATSHATTRTADKVTQRPSGTFFSIQAILERFRGNGRTRAGFRERNGGSAGLVV